MVDRGTAQTGVITVGCRFYTSRNNIVGGLRPQNSGERARLYDTYQSEGTRTFIAEIPIRVWNVTNNAPEIWLNVPISQIHLLNRFDFLEIVNDSGIVHTISINDYDIIRLSSQNNYQTLTPQEIVTRSLPNGQLSVTEIGMFNLNVQATYDVNNVRLFLTEITNVTFTDTLDLPILIPVLAEIQTYEGTVSNIDALVGKIQVGRFGEQFPVIDLPISGIENIPSPPNPNPEPIPSTIITLDNLAASEGEFLQARWLTNPVLPENNFASLTTFQQRILPSAGSILRRTYGTYPPENITFQSVNEGEQYRIWVELTTNDNRTFRSPDYNFNFTGGEVVLEVDNFHEFTIEQTKIFVLNVSQTLIELRLINEIFNNPEVESLTINANGAGEVITSVVENNGLGSNLDTLLSGLTPNTVYGITITANYRDMDVELDTFTIETLELLPPNPTPDDRKKEAEEKLIRRSYDYADASLIEVLDETERAQIVCGILSETNRPDSVQLVHDFNRKNRKGSIYNQGTSEAVKTQYIKSLEERLSDAVQLVPDIDEGYRA